MWWGTSRGDIGILCRDHGFLPRQIGGFERIQIEVDRAHQRKGNAKYARELINQLEKWQPYCLEHVLVVGDGVGDVRFCLNMEDLLRDRTPAGRVEGLFMGHQDLERFRGESGNAAIFDSWDDLSNELAAQLGTQESATKREVTLVLIDVDRTVLFPRLSGDKYYYSSRLGSMADYVMGFRSKKRHESAERGVEEFVDMVTTNLNEYNNEMNDLCFKNEEVVAVVTLLLSVGTVMPKWIKQPNARKLSWMLRYSIQKLEHGGWISGLERAEGHCASGEAAWEQTRLIQHLQSVLHRLIEDKPVLCPEFRHAESRRLASSIATYSSGIFNMSLLDTLRSSMPMPMLFLTDRPALSLGLSQADLDDRLGQAPFWGQLRRYVMGEEDQPLRASSAPKSGARRRRA